MLIISANVNVTEANTKKGQIHYNECVVMVAGLLKANNNIRFTHNNKRHQHIKYVIR